jgi:hypothetical protein
MKKIYLFSLLFIGSLSIQAQDDVYDAPEPKRLKVYTATPQQDESGYDPYENYDYDYNGYNNQNMGYSNRLRRMYSNQPFNNMAFMNPYAMANPYTMNMGFGFNNFYDPWMMNNFYDPYGFNSFNNFYNPYCNFGYGGFYRPFNHWNNWGNNWGGNWGNNWGGNWGNNWGGNWGNNNFRPRPQTPRRETPRGFSRSDDTYRPSPARTRPSTNNGGFGAAPSNTSRESNRYSSPSFTPASPSGNTNQYNQGGFGGTNRSTPPASSPPSNGNNRGRTGRF